MKSAAYLNEMPEELQKTGVQVVEYILGTMHPRPRPTPLVPSPSSRGPTSYTTVWTAAEIGQLRDVQAQYSITPDQAQKYGVSVLDYILAAGGH